MLPGLPPKLVGRSSLARLLVRWVQVKDRQVLILKDKGLIDDVASQPYIMSIVLKVTKQINIIICSRIYMTKYLSFSHLYQNIIPTNVFKSRMIYHVIESSQFLHLFQVLAQVIVLRV